MMMQEGQQQRLDLVGDKSMKHLNHHTRELKAPDDLKLTFWPIRETLQEMEHYESTSFWFQGMEEKTKKAYRSHLRLFCIFYSTTPDILVKLSDEQLKELLEGYLSHLLKVAVKSAGKPKPGQISVNSIGHYFTGLREFMDEHDKKINWKRLQKKFPKKVKNNLRGHTIDEIRKLYKNADVFDKPIVLLEYGTWVRVGGIPDLKFEDLMPIPEYDGYFFLGVYGDSADDFYPVVVNPEFMRDLNELKELRERWGEKITSKSYLICPKYGPRCKRPQIKGMKVSADGIRHRMRKLMVKCGLDMERIQPNHGMRKAGNTAAKNAHMDKEFKEMLMGHSTGLDDTYYDIENPQSRKEIVAEYMKAIDALTIDPSQLLTRENQELREKAESTEELKKRIDEMGKRMDSMMLRTGEMMIRQATLLAKKMNVKIPEEAMKVLEQMNDEKTRFETTRL